MLDVGNVPDPSDVEDDDRPLHGDASLCTLAAGGAPPIDGVASPVNRAPGRDVVRALAVREAVVEQGLRRDCGRASPASAKNEEMSAPVGARESGTCR